jgi:hypothetical protein
VILGLGPTGHRAVRPVYIPLTLLLGGALYVAAELLMKHLTLRNLQSQLKALPADIGALPTAPRTVTTETVDAARNQRSYGAPVAADTRDAMPAMQFDTESVLSFS